MKPSDEIKKRIDDCHELDDESLRRDVRFLAQREHHCLATLLIHLGEYDRRRLSEEEGYQSTYSYCVKCLGYDESGAYRRIHAARVCKRYPHILDFIVSGELSLTSLLLLSPVLTDSNHELLITQARGKSKRELESHLAELDPRPATPDAFHRMPAPPMWMSSAPASPNTASAPEILSPMQLTGVMPAQAPGGEWQAVMPLSLERVRVGFDAAVALMRLIERAKQILRHKYPEGRLEDVLREALEILIERKDPRIRLAPKEGELVAEIAPQPRFLTAWRGGRYIPARVKRAVWQRDDGRCTWRFEDGEVCGSRDALEFDHFRPFAKGGRSDDARNVRLLCRMHNRLAAEAAGMFSAGRAAS
jgi:hypothetical protein